MLRGFCTYESNSWHGSYVSPADDIEAKAMVKAAYEYVGPVYMRFGRLAVPVINDRPDYKFEMGKGIVLREGKDAYYRCKRTLCGSFSGGGGETGSRWN